MPDNGQQAEEDLAAMERFVVDNDALLELEERIGRFNIFDALGIVRTEIRHSNFLAWLLDPNESHGQGSLFLRAILMDLLRQSPPGLRLLSPIQLDGAELRGVRVWRERHRIDILIECDEPRFVIAIENKVDSSEHSEQLGRYKKAVRELFGDVRAQFVYLTREGDEPSDEEWTTYTYRDIHDTLQRVRNANAASIGDDVRTFLDHYLNLIGSRFMDDPKIDELCQTIYKNHRQAIDLMLNGLHPRVLKRFSRLRLFTRTILDGCSSTRRSGSYNSGPSHGMVCCQLLVRGKSITRRSGCSSKSPSAGNGVAPRSRSRRSRMNRCAGM
jgi:hypothetical protein